MTKKEFIKKFNLTRTNTKALFKDGFTWRNRTIYENNRGELYVFYNNDLHTVNFFRCTPYVKGMEELHCSLGAGYNWYH